MHAWLAVVGAFVTASLAVAGPTGQLSADAWPFEGHTNVDLDLGSPKPVSDLLYGVFFEEVMLGSRTAVLRAAQGAEAEWHPLHCRYSTLGRAASMQS